MQPDYKVTHIDGEGHITGPPPVLDRIKRKLTLRATQGRPFTLELFREERGGLAVPRTLVSKCGLPVSGEWGKIKGKHHIVHEGRYAGQAKLIDDFMAGLKSHSPYGGILQAGTDSGKTILGIKLAYLLGLKTLIIVSRDVLVNQWQESIKEFTNLSDKHIGLIRAGRVAVENKAFVIAMIHTLAQDTLPEWVRNEFGTVIFDEVHIVGAETFSRAAPMFNCKTRIGLSATADRKDGMQKVFEWHIGSILAQSETVQSNNFRVVAIPYRGQDASHVGCVWAGKLSLGKYYNRLANCSERTDLITRAIVKLYERGEHILVLSDRIKILEDLKIGLELRRVRPGDIGLFTSKKKQGDRRILLATAGTADLGMNMPRLTALVYATPRADIRQSVGRLRTREDGGQSVVVDIVDTASSIMRGWYGARRKIYLTKTKDITEVK